MGRTTQTRPALTLEEAEAEVSEATAHVVALEERVRSGDAGGPDVIESDDASMPGGGDPQYPPGVPDRGSRSAPAWSRTPVFEIRRGAL